MKLESQVASLELSKKLKSLGVKQESLNYWLVFRDFSGPPNICDDFFSRQACEQDRDLIRLSAFTVAELGELIGCVLDCAVFSQKMLEIWICSFAQADKEGVLIIEHQERWASEADSRAAMFIYLIEKGIVNP